MCLFNYVLPVTPSSFPSACLPVIGVLLPAICTACVLLPCVLYRMCTAHMRVVSQSLVYCISVIVATVPEGLLCTLTVALALTAKRMHVRQVLVKNLQVGWLKLNTYRLMHHVNTMTGKLAGQEPACELHATVNRLSCKHAWCLTRFACC